MLTRRFTVALVTAAALTLSACSSEPTATTEDRSACETVDQYGPDLAAALGGGSVDAVDQAARGLYAGLGDAGPDDRYSDDLSPYAQVVAADAALIGSQMISGGSSFGTPDTVDHLLNLAEACQDLGVEVDGFTS